VWNFEEIFVMNGQATITIEPETKTSTALAIIPAASLPTLIAADQTDILGKLRSELAGYTPDASTEPGRKEIGQKVRRIGVAKMDFKRLKEGLLEDAKKQVASVNAEYKVIETNCDALRDAIDGVMEAYKQIERDRVAGHEAAIRDIANVAFYDAGTAAAHWIEERIREAIQIHSDRNWQDFAQRAADTRATAIKYLNNDLEATRKREAEAAELARLRAEEAERARLAAIEAQRVREAEIAREAAETARLAAEAKAAREAEDAAVAVRQAQEAAFRKAQAERDAAARREREAAEALAAAERARVEAEQRAERERVEAIERERIAAERAEITRLAEIAKAEREKVEAIEAERRRVEAARAAEEAERARQAEVERVVAEKRAANRAHQAKINGEALAAIIRLMSFVHSGTADEAEKIGKSIIKAIALGEVPHITIGY
jgi:colicin import membrane protein